MKINDICPHCKKGKLKYAYANFPFSDEHLICDICDSTYNIKYDQMWSEDVNKIASKISTQILLELEERKMHITDDEFDKIFEGLQDILAPFSTGDYKNHL